MLLSCGGHGGSDDDDGGGSSAGGEYTLCDGSDEIRLGMASEGGQLEATYQFTNPYGHSFLFIDGHCHYFASAAWMKGVVEGELSPQHAAQIEKTVGLKRIDRLHYRADQSCPDAAPLWVRTAAGYVDCNCGCDKTAPEGVEASINAAGMLKDELIAQGTALEGAVSVLAIAEGESPASGAAQDWPFVWPLSDVATDVEAYWRQSERAMVRLLTGDQAASARALRARVLASDPYAFSIRVRDLGKTYDVYVRDELPDGTQLAIERFLAP